jgi:AcrR family transcriptional regulator
MSIFPESGGGRRAVTRERILDATRRMLARGATLHETTSGDIAAEAGVSRATFYTHFPDQMQLVKALYESEPVSLDPQSPPLRPEMTYDELRQAVTVWVMAGRRAAPVYAAIAELGEQDTTIRAGWKRSVVERSAEYTRWMQQCRSDLPERDAEVIGELIGWMGERALQRMVGPRDKPSCTCDELVDAITRVWWAVAHCDMN